MGAAESTPVPALDALPPDGQRNLLRNFQLLASRDLTEPGRFARRDWQEVQHAAAMPTPLVGALWRGLVGEEASTVSCDAVVQTVVPLQATGSTAAALAHLRRSFGGDDAAALAVAFDEAAPWLAAVGRATSQRREGGAPAAARVLADAALTAWLCDQRQLLPLPELADGETRLLEEHMVRSLAQELPLAQRRRWRLLYATRRDGCSFTRFLALGCERAPCLLVLRDASGRVFGAYASEPLRRAPRFGGGYGSFVFSLSAGAAAIHRASGDNGNFVYLNSGMEELPNGLAFGGNLEARYFGLWLRDDLESGRSEQTCSTFGSPCLASSVEFKLDAVELWAVAEDPPPPTEEEAAAAAGENALTAAGVLTCKHAETKAFVDLVKGPNRPANSGGSA